MGLPDCQEHPAWMLLMESMETEDLVGHKVPKESKEREVWMDLGVSVVNKVRRDQQVLPEDQESPAVLDSQEPTESGDHRVPKARQVRWVPGEEMEILVKEVLREALDKRERRETKVQLEIAALPVETDSQDFPVHPV